jgi:hypothetical protein
MKDSDFNKKGGETMKKTMILSIVLLLLSVAVSVMAQQTAPTETSVPAVPAPAAAPTASIEISRMEICSSVMDRKPVDVSSTFAATQDKVYCYLEFKDVKKETTVNMVWTLGQTEMGKISLTIKPYAKFRTWAYKSINGMKGDWKVDVVDDKGAILRTATFKIQ